MTEAGSTSYIVVGVDGSEPSKDALRWAAGQARLTGAEVHALTTWELPAGYGFVPDYSYTDRVAHVRDDLEETIRQVLGEEPDVQVVIRIERGHAAAALVDAGRGAELLVVGSRGRGAFTGMMLGSVSQHCAQHATCPVVIVRDEPEGAEPSEA